MEIRCDLGTQNTVIFIISCTIIGMYIAYFFVQFMIKPRLRLSPAQRDSCDTERRIIDIPFYATLNGLLPAKGLSTLHL